MEQIQAQIKENHLYEVVDESGKRRVVLVKQILKFSTRATGRVVPVMEVLFTEELQFKIENWRPWNIEGMSFKELPREDIALYINWHITGLGEKYLKKLS